MEQSNGKRTKKIRRTRTGCLTCRRRRIKCDERKPFCKACSRLGVDCHGYTQTYRFAGDAVPIQQGGPSSQALQIEEWSANLQLFDLQILSPPSADGQSQISSPAYGTPSASTTESIELHSAMSFLDRVWAPCFDNDVSPTRSHETIFLNLNCDTPASVENGISKCSREGFSNHTRVEKYRRPDRASKIHQSDIDDFYLSKWYSCVVGCLPPVFRDITADLPEFTPLRSAIVALAASYLAHIESSTLTTNAGGRKSRYLPQSKHRYRSLEAYNRGVRELAEQVVNPQREHIQVVLATSLLFHYLEIDAGSVVGAGGHMESIDKIVSSAYDDINASPTGQQLLCTWLVLRDLVVQRRLSIGLAFDKLPLLMSSDDVKFLMSKAATPYDSIMRLMCQSMSLTRVIILDWCVLRGQSLLTPEKKHAAFDSILTQLFSLESRDRSIAEPTAVDDRYWESLQQQRAKLDEWHAHLNLSELPIDSFTSQTINMKTEVPNSGLEVAPLRFQTHEAAMNYVYYAIAQMLSSQNVLEQLTTPDAAPEAFTNRNYPWEFLFLRITMGLDPAECVSKHLFKCGIASLLSLCAAWCPHIAVAKAAEWWILKLEKHGLAIEDGIPVTLIERELSFIMSEKKKCRDIFRISVLGASAETEMGELYQSDFKMLSAVCGKDRVTRKLYNDILKIP